MDKLVLGDTKLALSARSGSTILNNPIDPYHPSTEIYMYVVCHDPPSVLPPDRDVRHGMDLVPGTKYRVMR